MHKVYITGVGLLTVIGNSLGEFWENLLTVNKEAISKETVDIKLNDHEKKVARRMNRISKGALVTCRDAINNSNIKLGEINPFDIGTVFYSGASSLESTLEFNDTVYTKGPELASSIVFSSTVSNACVGSITVNYKLKGFSTFLNTINYLSYSILALKTNKAKGILCGGFEPYSKEYFEEFKSNSYVIRDSNTPAVIFNKQSQGFKIKEAMTAIMLQKDDSEYLDKQTILGELVGNGGVYSSKLCTIHAEEELNSSDFEEAMKRALDMADLDYSQIDGIIMAANGNKFMDRAEAKAVSKVFKEKAGIIPITSIKPAVGETLGASLNLNIIIGALVVNNGIMPRTQYLEDIDNLEHINLIRDNVSGNFRYIMVNGVCSLGGIVSHIIKKYEE